MNGNLIFQLLDGLDTIDKCEVGSLPLKEQHSEEVSDLSNCNSNNQTQQLTEYGKNTNLF